MEYAFVYTHLHIGYCAVGAHGQNCAGLGPFQGGLGRFSLDEI